MTSPKSAHKFDPNFSKRDAEDGPPATPASELFPSGWATTFGDNLHAFNPSPLDLGAAGSELHHRTSSEQYHVTHEENTSDPGDPMDMTDEEDSGMLASGEDSSSYDEETTSALPAPAGAQHGSPVDDGLWAAGTEDQPIELDSEDESDGNLAGDVDENQPIEINSDDDFEEGQPIELDSADGADGNPAINIDEDQLMEFYSDDDDADWDQPEKLYSGPESDEESDGELEEASEGDLVEENNGELDQEPDSSTMLADGTAAAVMDSVEVQDAVVLETDTQEDVTSSEEATSEPESLALTEIPGPTTTTHKPKQFRLRCDMGQCIHILRCGHAVVAIDPSDGWICGKNCIRKQNRSSVKGEFGCRLCLRLNNGHAVSWYLHRLDDLLLPRYVPADEPKKMAKYRLTEIVFLVSDSDVFPRAIRAPPNTGVIRTPLSKEELAFDVAGATVIAADTLKNIGDIRSAVSVAATREHQRYEKAKKAARTLQPRVDLKAREELISQIEHFSNQLELEVAPDRPAGWGAKMTACYIFELVEYGTKLSLFPVDVVMAACIVTGFERLQFEVAGVFAGASIVKVCELMQCKVDEVEAAMIALKEALYCRAVTWAGYIPRSFKRTTSQQEVLVWIAKEMFPKV